MTLSTQAALAKDKRAGIPTFEHRHFAYIASVIQNITSEDGCLNSRQSDLFRADLAERFADKLALTNERFDRARFLKACRAK